jgi:hypothetical protein
MWKKPTPTVEKYDNILNFMKLKGNIYLNTEIAVNHWGGCRYFLQAGGPFCSMLESEWLYLISKTDR